MYELKLDSARTAIFWGNDREKKRKERKKHFVLFPVANPYLHNASRTNKTSSSGIVREAQREANTDMKKSQKTIRQAMGRSEERCAERVTAGFCVAGGPLEGGLEKKVRTGKEK